MFLSVSAALLLGAAIFGLVRFGRLAPSHVALCTLFGFVLSSTSLAPYLSAVVRAGARFLAGIEV